jgi:hypothetical protein
MNEILQYIQKRYQQTKWPYFNLLELKLKFGENTRYMLNDLFKQGIVSKCEGANHPLVKFNHEN